MEVAKVVCLCSHTPVAVLDIVFRSGKGVCALAREMPQSVMLFHVVLCYEMLCHSMLRCAVLCCVMYC